jgi:hypothetical protein
MVCRNRLALAALEVVRANGRGVYKPSLCRGAGRVPAAKRARALKLMDTLALLRRVADRCRTRVGLANLTLKRDVLARLDADSNIARKFLRDGDVDAAITHFTLVLNIHTHPCPFKGLVHPSPFQVPIEVFARYRELVDSQPNRFLTLFDLDATSQKKQLARLAARLWRRYAVDEVRESVARVRAEAQALANAPRISAAERADVMELFRAGVRRFFA